MNGEMHGKGIKQDKEGNMYVGQFSHNQMHGQAIWYNIERSTKRQGEWAHGKRVAWTSKPVPVSYEEFSSQYAKSNKASKKV